MKRCNIIIPVKNRPELAVQTIESLQKHTDRFQYDLTVYFDNADNETYQAVIGLPAFFHTISTPIDRGPGWCRNSLAKTITEQKERLDFLYFADSDVYFMEGWLEALIEAYGTFPDVKVFGAASHPYHLTNQVLERDGITVHTKDAIPGFSHFMDWDTWDKYGPYAEPLGIMGSEDWELCQRVINDGNFVASLWPEKIVHCGKTNSYGKPATGHELMKPIEGHPEIKIL